MCYFMYLLGVKMGPVLIGSLVRSSLIRFTSLERMEGRRDVSL